MASGDQATGTPDYQLRRKVAIGMVGIEPTFLRPKRSVMPFYYIPFQFSRGVVKCLGPHERIPKPESRRFETNRTSPNHSINIALTTPLVKCGKPPIRGIPL
jgi:hypothetical protein